MFFWDGMGTASSFTNHVKPRFEAKSTGSAIEAVLLSIEMHAEMHTIRSRRYATTQTRSSLISLTVKVVIGAPDPSS
jgi:hypothetical protein